MVKKASNIISIKNILIASLLVLILVSFFNRSTTMESCTRLSSITPLQTTHLTKVEQLMAKLKNSSWPSLVLDDLGDIKDPVAVVPMIDVLNDINRYNDHVRERAAENLGRMRDPRAVQSLIASLNLPGDDKDVEREAAQALGKIGDPRAVGPLIEAMRMERDADTIAYALADLGEPSVAPLIGLLSDSNPKVRGGAIKGLGMIGAPAVGPLIDASRSSDTDVSSGATGALYSIKDCRAVEPLIEALNDENVDVRRSAAWALGEIGDSYAIDPLLSAMKDDDDKNVSRNAAISLGKLKDSRAALEPLIEAIGSGDYWIRLDAIRALGNSGDARAIDPLIKLLNDADINVQMYAGKALKSVVLQTKSMNTDSIKQLIRCKSEHRIVSEPLHDVLVIIGEPAILPLVEALNDSDSIIRRRAALYLGAINDTHAVKPLLSSRNDDDPFVRVAIVDALARLNDTRSIEPLIAALNDDDPYVRAAVVDTLGRLNDTGSIKLLIAALNDTDGYVRGRASIALRGMNDTRLVEPMIAALDDWEWGVRMNAAFVLGELRDPRAIKPLIAALASDGFNSEFETDHVGDIAASSLGRIGELAVEPLIETLSSSRDVLVRRNAAIALGNTKDPRAVEPLVNAIREDDSFVRISAAMALAEIKDDRAIGPLLAIIKEEPRYRIIIGHAIGKFGEPAIDPLLEMLNHSDSKVRYAAATALSDIQNPRIIEPMIKALEDEDSGVRREAIKALGKQNDPRAVLPLITMLRDSHVSDGAMNALIEIGDPSVEPLICVLDHPNPRVRWFAVYALGEIGNRRAINPLKAAMRDNNPTVRFIATTVLFRIESYRFSLDSSHADHLFRGKVHPALIDAFKENGIFLSSCSRMTHEDYSTEGITTWSIHDRNGSYLLENLRGGGIGGLSKTNVYSQNHNQ